MLICFQNSKFNKHKVKGKIIHKWMGSCGKLHSTAYGYRAVWVKNMEQTSTAEGAAVLVKGMTTELL